MTAQSPALDRAKIEAPTRYWFDTEFIEDGKTIELLSIGIVAEDGREYYAESSDADHDRADDWVRANVIAHLRGGSWEKPRKQIAEEIVAFVGKQPEFWAYYADYDWVVLCQLFGRMIDLPKGWPMFCRDIKQWCMDLGNPRLPSQDEGEHHALSDARWNKVAFQFLEALSRAAPGTDMVLVPREPTEAMVAAGYQASVYDAPAVIAKVWATMIAAATPKEEDNAQG